MSFTPERSSSRSASQALQASSCRRILLPQRPRVPGPVFGAERPDLAVVAVGQHGPERLATTIDHHHQRLTGHVTIDGVVVEHAEQPVLMPLLSIDAQLEPARPSRRASPPNSHHQRTGSVAPPPPEPTPPGPSTRTFAGHPCNASRPGYRRVPSPSCCSKNTTRSASPGIARRRTSDPARTGFFVDAINPVQQNRRLPDRRHGPPASMRGFDSVWSCGIAPQLPSLVRWPRRRTSPVPVR